MNKNERKWRKWYLENVGKAWQDGDGLDESELSDRQKQTGALLYRRYLAEKQDAQDHLYRMESLRAQSLAAASSLDYRKALRDRYAAETALSYGKAGSAQTELYDQEAQANYIKARQSLQKQARQNLDSIQRAYVNAQKKADAALDKDLDRLDRTFAKEDEGAWRDLRKQLEQELSHYTDGFDTDTYTQEGIQKAKQRVQDSRDALGTSYEQALAWVESLPKVNDKGQYTYFSGGDGTDYRISTDEYRLADAVKYVRGAGVRLNSLDVITLQYKGDTYKLRRDTAVSAKQNALLEALAQQKQMGSKVGTMLYYGQALYVYDGRGTWYTTRSGVSPSREDSLDRLLRRIREDNLSKEES